MQTVTRALPAVGDRRALQVGIGVVLTLLVVPISGHVVLLDLSGGPLWSAHADVAAYGTLRSAVPVEWVLSMLARAGLGDLARVLPLLLTFPAGMVAMGRLVSNTRVTELSAGALYVCNPFVFDRIAAGQASFLLGYALLPLFVRSVLDAREAKSVRRLRPALWLVVETALSIHFLVIGAFVLLAVALVYWSRMTAIWVLGTAATTALLCGYFVVPLIGRASSISVDSSELDVYRTVADPVWGLYLNVLGLYGFWRPGPTLPKAHQSAWPLLLGVIMLLSAGGMMWSWRNGRRRTVVLLISLATAGYFLALGDQGPTGSLYRLMTIHLPGFAAMREAQKWDCLLAMGYAYGFGLGIRFVLNAVRGRLVQMGVACLCTAVPFSYTATIFGGLDGQIRPVQFPASWTQADKVMGRGPGRVLFLPWEEYSSYSWTRGEVIANPAAYFFHRRVIAGDNISVPHLYSDSTSPRSTYLEDLFAAGPDLYRFGHLVAQLGVKYIVLVKAPTYRQYGWLYQQQDLSVAYEGNGITVFSNDSALPQGARLVTSAGFPSVQAYIASAQKTDMRGVAAFLDKRALPGAEWTGAPPVADVRQTSTNSYRIAAGPPGWIVVPVVTDPWWRDAGRSPRLSLSGVALFPSAGASGTARFLGPGRDRLGIVVSGSVLGLFALWELALIRQRRPRSCRRTPDWRAFARVGRLDRRARIHAGAPE